MDFSRGVLIGLGIVAALIAISCAVGGLFFGGCALLVNSAANDMHSKEAERTKAHTRQTQEENRRLDEESRRLDEELRAKGVK